MNGTALDWKDLLESRNSISILLCLREHDSLMKTELYSRVSRNQSMPERIVGLERIGLLSTLDRGKATLVGLTHRGMIVADHLAEIQEIMEDHDGSVSGSNPSSKT